MLKNPTTLRTDDQLLACFADSLEVVHIEPGVIQIRHHNGDRLLYTEQELRSHPIYYEYPVFPEYTDLHCYGVADTPQQFLAKYRDILEQDPRTFTVTFKHIAKDVANKGQGGGWRWHKWGPYIGTGDPQCEYLDDEDGFDNGVYTFHIYQVA